MAAERWGGGNRLLVHKTQILKTSAKDRAEGWPPFVIAGLPLEEGEDPFDARVCLPLIIRAVLEDTRTFNAEHGNLIQTIGFDSDFTGIRKLPPLEATEIICAVYDKAMSAQD